MSRILAGDFPAIPSKACKGAKLYANRLDMVQDIRLPANPVIAEIGVALAGFSLPLVEHFRPKEFHAFDVFLLHKLEVLWGMPVSQALQGKTHLDFYREAMAAHSDCTVIHEGDSAKTMKEVDDAAFDLVYIDGQHTYEPVLEDAKQSARCLKPGGVLIFNDYVLYNPFQMAEYGIVEVVNDMVAKEGWRVIGFALQRHMFCDIAITRS